MTTDYVARIAERNATTDSDRLCWSFSVHEEYDVASVSWIGRTASRVIASVTARDHDTAKAAALEVVNAAPRRHLTRPLHTARAGAESAYEWWQRTPVSRAFLHHHRATLDNGRAVVLREGKPRWFEGCSCGCAQLWREENAR